MAEPTAVDERATHETDGSKRPAAVAVLALFALALVASHAPIWGARLLFVDVLSLGLVAGALSLGLMLLLPILLARWKPAAAAFDVRWLPTRAVDYCWALALLVVCAAVVAGYGLAAQQLGWPRYAHLATKIELIPLGVIVIGALTAILATPIVEELFWRGFALAQFTRVMPAYAAIVLQAVLWSAVHGYPAGQSVLVFIFGVILGWWRFRKRALVPLIVAHLLWNAAVVGPVAFRHYREQQMLGEMARDPLTATFVTDMIESNRRARRSPQGVEIDRLARRSAANAVPKLIRFVTDADQDVQIYAHLVITLRYADTACRYLDQALDSDDDVLVTEVIGVIAAAGCRDSATRVRQIVMESPNTRVQTAGLLTLGDLGDVESLRELASAHPSERIRDAARRTAARLTGTTEDAPCPAA